MKSIVWIAVIVVIIAGCRDRYESSNDKVATVQINELEQPEDEKQQKPVAGSQQIESNPDWDKKIIKTATLVLRVDDFSKSSTQIRELARKHGGYIALEKQEQDTYQIKNTITMKVPVAQFELAMNELALIKSSTEERIVTSEDVTVEVVDTRARIETKKQIRQRYLDLLKQAKNMEEILNVQNVINQTQEEIELASNRMDYLNHASGMSTINLTYYQVLDPSVKKPPEHQNFNDHIFSAFLQGWQLIKGLLLVCVTIWPLLLAGVLIFIFYKKRKTTRRIQA